jgi:FKBP-type peptidyl-prolyl cis-trans isomerase FkpA
MRLRLVLLLAATATLLACAQATQPAPKTDDEKALYALGVLMSQNIKPFDFTDKELELVKAGMADGARGKETMDADAMQAFIPKLQELQTTRVAAALKREKEAGTAFIAKAAAEPGAQKTASGLVYKSLKEGTGAAPKETDTVKVHYEGKFADGKVFDSSIKRNEPATFPLNGVIPCWTEGVQMMKVGGKAHITCPPELAYGDEGHPPQMRGGATLGFDVELLDIEKPAAAGTAAPAAPAPAK